MATKAKSKAEAKDQGTSSRPILSEEMAAEFQAAYDAQEPLRRGWDEKENLLIAKLGDSVSASFKSRVTDARLSTLALEASARVMAQIPMGTVQALTKKDAGKSAVVTLALNKYVQPNDNAQFDHLTKMRMTNLYSRVYGVMPVLYDIDVREDYLGPATWILPIRSWFPQPGKLSVDDSDYNFVETWHSVSWLEAQKGKGSWNTAVLDEIISRAKKEGGTSKTQQPVKDRSVVERQREWNVPGGHGAAAQIRMLTRYGNGKDGKWISWFPDYDKLIGREAKSKDGHIPIVLKHHYPLVDSIYGLGMFERGKTLQYAMDSLNSMYMAGVQMSIFPPRIIVAEQVDYASLDYAPGRTWQEKTKDSIRNFQVSPDGLATFQSTYSWLTGSLLNQNGATDTSQTVANTADPQAGKTPEALKMQAQRESAADKWDVYMQEKFLEKLYERMVNLLPQVPKPFTFHIFDAEIEQLTEAGLDDAVEVYDSKKAGRATINTSELANCEYKYIINTGTTLQQDQEAEHLALTEIITQLAENPQLQYYLNNEGKQLKIGTLIERWVMTGGINYADELITKTPQATGPTGSPAPGQQGANPMFYPSKRMIESIDYADLDLWAQVQLLQLAGIQVPPAVQAMAQQQAQNPPAPVDPNAPEAPDATKDPNHQMLMALLDKLDPASLRAVIRSVGLPASSMLPTEADMIEKLSQPTPADEQPIAEDIHTIEVDPSSPYGAAKDPLAHLAASKDPAVQGLFKHIQSSGQPGVPLEATEPKPAGAAK